jgi:transketolase N-terminal domain/subunit
VKKSAGATSALFFVVSLIALFDNILNVESSKKRKKLVLLSKLSAKIALYVTMGRVIHGYFCAAGMYRAGRITSAGRIFVCLFRHTIYAII